MLATGADISLAKKLGLVTTTQADALAIRGYVHSDLQIESLIFSFETAILPGYAWIFPLPSGVYNVGFGVFGKSAASGVNLREYLNKFLGSFPLAQELLRYGEFVSEPKGARLRCGFRGSIPIAFDGKVMLIGENIGTTFQATGEGIGKAMESGLLAADLAANFLISGDEGFLLQYPQLLNAELKPKYRGYQIAERCLSVPWIADLVARRANRSLFILDSLRGIVNETSDPDQVFSLKGIIKSFVS